MVSSSMAQSQWTRLMCSNSFYIPFLIAFIHFIPFLLIILPKNTIPPILVLARVLVQLCHETLLLSSSFKSPHDKANRFLYHSFATDELCSGTQL